MAYESNQWHHEDRQNLPRRPSSKWLMGVGLGMSIGWAILFPVIQPKATGSIQQWLFLLPVLFGGLRSPFNGGVWGNRKKLKFDEFEERALNRAATISYRFVTILGVLLCGWCYLSLKFDLPGPSTAAHWAQWAWTFFLSAFLPVLVAEIIIPMPPIYDEDA
jgi:hypothetical protein